MSRCVPRRETEPEWFPQDLGASKQQVQDLNSRSCNSRLGDSLASLLAWSCRLSPQATCEQRDVLSFAFFTVVWLGITGRPLKTLAPEPLDQGPRTLSSDKCLDIAGAAGPGLQSHCSGLVFLNEAAYKPGAFRLGYCCVGHCHSVCCWTDSGETHCLTQGLNTVKSFSLSGPSLSFSSWGVYTARELSVVKGVSTLQNENYAMIYKTNRSVTKYSAKCVWAVYINRDFLSILINLVKENQRLTCTRSLNHLVWVITKSAWWVCNSSLLKNI